MANKLAYEKTGLTGGGTGDLDIIDGTILSDGDFAFVITGSVFYVYILDDNSGEAESSPDIISPDSNAGTKRWILQYQYNTAKLNTMNDFTASQQLHGDALLFRWKDSGASGEEWGIRSDGGNLEICKNTGTEGTPVWTVSAVVNANGLDGTIIGANVASSGTFTTETVTTQIWKDATELTISSGVVTATQTIHMIDTEGDGATDDLVTINGGVAGQLLAIRATNTARTVVVKETGNILCGGSDISLDDINKYLLLFYDGTLSKWVVVGGSGSGGGAIKTITQTTHGFAVGAPVRFNGTSYVGAQADSAENAEVVGIVSVVSSADIFTLSMSGYISGLSGLVAGSVYFLSATSAGALTAIEPTTVGYISKPLLIAISTTEGYFFNWRGMENVDIEEFESAVPVGALFDWPTETVPDGWLERNGASLVRADYADLFAVIGTMYGTADATHFNLPDDRGRFGRWWAHGQTTDPDRATRTVPGATGATLTAGDHVGTEQVDEFESHTHSVNANVYQPVAGYAHYNSGSTFAPTTLTINATGGNETRPLNRAYMPIIKY